MKEKSLSDAILYVAWGYILIHLSFNLGAFDLLPDWLGYFLFYRAINVIGVEEPSAKLLQPLVIIFGIWDVLSIFLGDIEVVTLLVTVLSLYFHFQFLTNLANLAEKHVYEHANKIVTLRTVRTILLTILAFPIPWNEVRAAAVGLIIVNLVVAIWICVELFSVRSWFKTMGA